MIRIKILMVGKATKEPWIEAGVDHYLRRMVSTLEVSTLFLKDDSQLLSHMEKERCCLALDPRGRVMTSETFADTLALYAEKGGARLTFVIGGAEGLPQAARERADVMISFSALTFPHQLCRLILAEQLYRSCELWRGSPYHK